MKKVVLTILCMAVSMTALSAGPLSGRRIPSFTLPDSNANYHDILDYRGKVVLVEVMQTQLEKVQEKYGSKVPILSIVVPPDNSDSVKQFAARYHIRYPILFDCGQVTASLGIPR
jgi:peroxiredoxin